MSIFEKVQHYLNQNKDAIDSFEIDSRSIVINMKDGTVIDIDVNWDGVLDIVIN